MSYLLIEIFVCLLIAGLIGFIIGWSVRGESKNNTLNKKSTTKESETKVSTDTIDSTQTTSENRKEEINRPPNLILLSKPKEEGKDNLSLIKGIGPKVEDKLNKLGIYHFEQIASWDTEQQAWIDMKILFPKKVEREEWVKQAKEFS